MSDNKRTRALTDENGQRVPSRSGATEWALDSVDWESATVITVCVAMCMAIRLDDALMCWPRQALIAEDARTSTRSVSRAVADLESNGIMIPLYLWSGRDCRGCLYVANVDEWLDDVASDPVALLKRVSHVRQQALAKDRVKPLAPGVELSTRRPVKRTR